VTAKGTPCRRYSCRPLVAAVVTHGTRAYRALDNPVLMPRAQVPGYLPALGVDMSRMAVVARWLTLIAWGRHAGSDPWT
jgi:hypothetical protein